MDVFDHFVVKHEDKEGKEEFFNLLRGKKEVVKYVEGNLTKGREWYELIESDFDEFIQTLQ